MLAALARLSPAEGWTDPDLARALRFLDAPLADSEVTAAAAGALGVGLVAGLVAAVLAPPGLAVTAGVGVLSLGCGVAYLAVRLPLWLATARRARAFGDAPGLVARAVLRMRVAPALEGAAEFAARQGDGPLAASLDEHARSARGTPRSGWAGFAEEWAAWHPSLRRAVSLLRAGADAPAGDRGRVLDRALAVVLDGTRDRMAAFADAIRGPATAIYTFGVVVPLALVAMLPAARAAGLPVSVGAVALVLDAVLPTALLAASVWLLGRRPAAFPPVPVPRSHPDVPDRRAPAAVAGLVAAVAVWLLAGRLVPAWTRWVCAPGVGVGTALVVWYRPVVRVRDRVRAVEAGLTDALALAGQRLREGSSAEAAIAGVGETLDGPTGEVVADAARVQRQLRVGVEAAFVGEHGALGAVPSPRARAAAGLLALAAREGPHGGRLLVEVAGHLDDLRAVEREARREVAAVTGTLRNTAVVFAPLVAGATVALAGRLDAAGLARFAGDGAVATPLPVGGLGIAVGGYVLAMAALLSALAVGLERGLDRSHVGYQVGVAFLSASVTYPAAVVGAGSLV